MNICKFCAELNACHAAMSKAAGQVKCDRAVRAVYGNGYSAAQAAAYAEQIWLNIIAAKAAIDAAAARRSAWKSI
ncbi:MAG: hypothetical protein LBL46_01450 [Rickettsiales bacterium]|jgi:hypothetical protein|nr:hypothetical protein [Rickettsiales bacterium]